MLGFLCFVLFFPPVLAQMSHVESPAEQVRLCLELGSHSLELGSHSPPELCSCPGGLGGLKNSDSVRGPWRAMECSRQVRGRGRLGFKKLALDLRGGD